MNATIQTAQAAGSSVVGTVLSFSTDVFVIAGIFALLFTWGIWKGKHGLVTLTLSLLISVGIFKVFPYVSVYALSPFIPLIVFVAIVAITYFVLTGLLSTFSFDTGFGKWAKTGALAVLATTLIISITYHVVSIPIYHWSGAVDFLFKSDQYFFWWLLSPFVALFFI